MNDQMWERVKEVFHQALKKPAEERGQFLTAACGDDDALRTEVEALLASHDEIGDDSLVSSSDEREGRVFPVEGPGSVIGRYKPLEEIGEGGMGVVYLAQQEQPVRRKVALKIIKLGMDTKEVIARFEAERQALAIMDHTNIAKVFDAGTTERGRPYFVMEYVSGIPITDYCDQNRLNARERLKLFIAVCQAIHHAHQRGIIHRDVKPSNVLVTVQDGKPVPKVIDFGVAKATNQRLTEKTLFTTQGILIGTPGYMSPEQADMTELDVDTTTDVYSLGVLLYELLAGAPPFDPKSLRGHGYEALRRVIREVEPPKPSTRFSSLGDEGTTVAERRRTEPASLERQIRGELDWITMRAIEKDRSRRYQSASEFAADIERYLHDEPVEAGPPGRTYRMRKFAHRHKGGVGLVAAAMVILTGFAVMMTVQADRIARERDRAQLEAKRSQVEAEFVQAVLRDDFIDRLRAQAHMDHFALLGRQLWELHQQSLAGNPAELALCAANTLMILDVFRLFGPEEDDRTEIEGLKGEIEPELFRLIDQSVAERDTSILKTLEVMIEYVKDGPKHGKAESDAVVPLFRDAIAVCQEARSPEDPCPNRHLERFAQYLVRSGRVALEEDRLQDAERYLREALQLMRESGVSGERFATTQGLFGESLVKQQRYSEAEPHLLESLQVLDTRDELVRVIELYESWGKPDKAEQFRKGLMVESVREIGRVGTPEVRGMWGSRGFSALFKGRSVWVFQAWDKCKWAWTDDLKASDGIRLYEPSYIVDSQRDLLPFTPDEKAYNDAHGTVEPSKWTLTAGPVIADPDRDRALVVYNKRLKGPDRSYNQAGCSLAIWEHPDSSVVRPVFSPESKYPTLLFQGDVPGLGAGALVDDGFLYLYSANYVSCQVARAPLAEALDRSAWRFYAGNDRWTRDRQSSANIYDGGTTGVLSIHWNDYLGKYLIVHGRPGVGGVFIQTADRPEGPWSPHRRILEGIPSDRGGNQGLVAHAEFAREGGRVEYITYLRGTGQFRSEIRLVEITFK